VLPALALAGAPLTSGAIAKIALKGVASKAPASVAHLLEWMLPLAAVGTTLLMARFLMIALARAASDTVSDTDPLPAARRGHSIAFVLLLAVVAGWAWVVDAEPVRYAVRKAFDPHYLWVLAWPVGAGVLVSAAVWTLRSRIPKRVATAVPPGDLWEPMLYWADARWVAYQASLAADGAPTPAPAAGTQGVTARIGAALAAASRVESSLARWAVAGTAFAVVGIAALLLMG
jgi:hypothetical protein